MALATDPRRGAIIELCWRVGAFAGFLVEQVAARRMVDARLRHDPLHGRHGVTAGRRELRQPRIALRAVAQSMARELGLRGIHVAHITIDGQIGDDDTTPTPDSRLRPEAIAQAYLDLHRQQRSAWTQEMDLRPWVERFWRNTDQAKKTEMSVIESVMDDHGVPTCTFGSSSLYAVGHCE